MFNRDVSREVARAVAEEAERVGAVQSSEETAEFSIPRLMKVAVTGATGTLGRALVSALVERGDEVVALSRNPESARETLGAGVEVLRWADPKAEPAEPRRRRTASSTCSASRRPALERPREAGDPRLARARHAQPRRRHRGAGPAERPRVLVSQSASGWYGPRRDERVDESEPAAGDWLAQVVVGWEAEAKKAEELGVRVVRTRTGVVLSESGGALEKMLPPFKLGVGGPVAGGRQYMPWIHTDDVVGALLFALETEAATGPLNLSAPEPVTNKELSKTLGRVLRRPAFAPVPALAVKTLYGEMAEIVTTGVRMVPKRLEELGYEFRRPDLEDALRAATGR